MEQKFEFKIFNGRIKIYAEGCVMFSFNQIDFAGYYAYKDDTDLYGIDIYLLRQGAGQGQMEIYFKKKQTWLNILKLLDENL
jgi:hypothetical protein